MSAQLTVLLVGGTGRTGRHVLEQLLRRGVSVRALVRSTRRLPEGIAGESRLTVSEVDLLSLDGEALVAQVRGCDAVISCLGHVISIKGVLGPPRDLVTRVTERLCRAIQESRPDSPVKYILMSSVSVNHPGARDARRGTLEKLLLWVLRGLLPLTGQSASRGFPLSRDRDEQPARAVGCGSPGHPPRRRCLDVLATRKPCVQPLQAGQYQLGERCTLHLRSGH